MRLQRELGRAIRRHREIAGLSQVQLADGIGRSAKSIGTIERGERAPSFEALEAISRALHVPVRDFFPATSPVDDEVMARVLGMMATLSGQELMWVERVLRAMLRK